jgi:hypothetical protein
MSLNNVKYTAILKGLHNAIALDYHYSMGLVYWSDMSLDMIRRAHINGSEPEGNIYFFTSMIKYILFFRCHKVGS